MEGPFHNFIANGIVTHNSVNEYSTRYSIAIDASQTTPAEEWRLQAAGNRQGSEGFLDEEKGKEFTKREKELQDQCRSEYEARLEAGIAREQARKDLPLSTYTEAYWKIDLHNLLHFLVLRMAENAQYEIRAYADVIGKEILAKWCPITWEAFLDYRFNAVSYSGLELQVLQALNSGNTIQAMELAEKFGWLSHREDGTLKRNRERIEFEEKLKNLNLKVPWQE
ncbi:MAG: FAD-dependent thymidylate synthase [Calditrichae bacterium]|nr:FAD-dependent thymidylate synthase [Calditrichia bacterium]